MLGGALASTSSLLLYAYVVPATNHGSGISPWRAALRSLQFKEAHLAGTRTYRRAAPMLSADAEDDAWSDEEDWAIIDTASDFTVGEGTRSVATFWTALAASNAALCLRTAGECEQRAAELVAKQNVTLALGPEPRVLDAWIRQPDGRMTGRIDGRTIWLTVALEGRLQSDPRSDAGYIEAVGGAVYELGASADAGAAARDVSIAPAASAPSPGGGFEEFGILRGVVRSLQLSPQAEASVPVLMSFALVGALGYLAGSQPNLAALLGAGPSTVAVQNVAQTPAPPPQPALSQARGYASAERVSLTVSEQRARQQCVPACDQTVYRISAPLP